MNDTTWIRTWNSKGIYIDTGTIYNLGHAYFACNSGYNVGIGTSAPSYKLHVSGYIYTTTGFKKNGSSNSYVLLGGGGHKAVSDFATAGHNHFTRLSGTNIDTELGNMTNWHYEISNATGTLPFTETWR